MAAALQAYLRQAADESFAQKRAMRMADLDFSFGIRRSVAGTPQRTVHCGF